MTDKTNILDTLREALDEQDRRITAARGQQIKAEGQLERIDKILAGGQIDQASGDRERKLLNLVAYYHRGSGAQVLADRYETAATRQAIKERDEALARVANEPIMLDEYRRQLSKIKAAYEKAVGVGTSSTAAIVEYITAAASGAAAEVDPRLAALQALADDLLRQRDVAQVHAARWIKACNHMGWAVDNDPDPRHVTIQPLREALGITRDEQAPAEEVVERACKALSGHREAYNKRVAAMDEAIKVMEQALGLKSSHRSIAGLAEQIAAERDAARADLAVAREEGSNARSMWAASEQRIAALEAKLVAAEKRAAAAEHDLEALDELVHAARKSFPTTAPPEDLLTLGPKLRAMGPALRQLREQHGIRLADFARATDAHTPALATIELGLEPLWDAMLSADEAEKRLGTVPPESDLHAALRNIKLREEVAHLKNERRKDKDALDDLQRRADGLAKQVELAHTAHTQTRERAKAAERLAEDRRIELQTLKVNPCTTCVRERDTARAERDEAMRRAEAAERSLAASRDRVRVECADGLPEGYKLEYVAAVAGWVVARPNSPAEGAVFRSPGFAVHTTWERLAQERILMECAAALPPKYKLERCEPALGYRWSRACGSLGTLHAGPGEAVRQAWGHHAVNGELADLHAAGVEVCGAAMPTGYKLMTETTSGVVRFRWNTHSLYGPALHTPVMALVDAWQHHAQHGPR